MNGDPIKLISDNRRARFNYHLLESFEAGVVLTGTEVKSLRDGKLSLGDSYCRVDRQGEVYLMDAHIAPYAHGNRTNHDPLRPRKLLLRRREIRRLIGKVREKGLTLVPTKVFFRRGKVKVEFALAKGKRQYDKREAIKQRDTQRELRRADHGL
jgi:SsrA-binding protein